MADKNKTQQGNNMQPEPKKPEMPKQPEQAATAPQAPEAAPVAKEPTPAEQALKAVIDAALKKTQDEAASKTVAPAEGAPKTKVDRWPDRKRKSTVANPVQFMWNLADAMKKVNPTVRRTDVIKAGIEAGVAGYTARTQYQAWYEEQRKSQREAALTAQRQAAGELKVGAKG